MSPGPSVPTRYRWAAPGDLNAFFGLMLDNVMNLVILAGILIGVFGFPQDVVYTRMFPGTALGRAVRRPRVHVDGLPPGAARGAQRRHRDAAGPRRARPPSAWPLPSSAPPSWPRRRGCPSTTRPSRRGRSAWRAWSSSGMFKLGMAFVGGAIQRVGAQGGPAGIDRGRGHRPHGLPAARRDPGRAGGGHDLALPHLLYADRAAAAALRHSRGGGARWPSAPSSTTCSAGWACCSTRWRRRS